jgi:hypothetical protein
MESELPNIKKWIVLYPVYINSKKTVAEGRRIGIAKACENPTCAEIGDCCNYLKLPYAIEVFFLLNLNPSHCYVELFIGKCINLLMITDRQGLSS